MDLKAVFTRKRLAAIVEAHQLLQVAVDEVRQAFIDAANGEENKVFWPMFDLQLLHAARKVTKREDSALRPVTDIDLRRMAFLAFGEAETMESAKHMPDTQEVISLALSGKNPSEVARQRAEAENARNREIRKAQQAELEAQRDRELTEEELLEESSRMSQESKRRQNQQAIARRLGR